MRTRLRDIKRYIKPQQEITFEEWELVMDKYNQAQAFLSEESFIHQIMLEDLEKVKTIIFENRVHEVHENKKITDNFRKIFITSKQEQVDELVGQVKYIQGILDTVKSWIEMKEELEAMEAQGKITIERNAEKRR